MKDDNSCKGCVGSQILMLIVEVCRWTHKWRDKAQLMQKQSLWLKYATDHGPICFISPLETQRREMKKNK